MINKPMMSDTEIEIIDNLLIENKPKVCLEWGAGYSTSYFTNKHLFIEKWVAIENRQKWYDNVNPLIDKKRVDLRLKNIPEYFDVKGKYDFILIDGIEDRNICLYQARKLINSKGFILLHDSEREIYNMGISLYGTKYKMLCRGEKVSGDSHRGLIKLWI